MAHTTLRIGVGRRGPGDKKKVKIPGTLFMSRSKSDKLVVFTTGLFGNRHFYEKHFGALLGKELNV